MITHFRIRNLDHYQHYRDRRPPWVKLYQTVLDEVWFSCLQDASKAHCILLILLASRLDNCIPYDAGFVQRSIQATEPIDLELLLSVGWIEACPAPVAASKRASKGASKSASKKGGEKERRRSTPKGGASRAADAAQPVPGDAPSDAAERSVNWVATVVADWRTARGGELSHGEVGRVLKPLVDRHGFDAVRPAWQAFVGSPKAEFGPRQFARDFGTYAPGAAPAMSVHVVVPAAVRPAPADPRAELANLRADWQQIKPAGGARSRAAHAAAQLDTRDWDRRYLRQVYPALADALDALRSAPRDSGTSGTGARTLAAVA